MDRTDLKLKNILHPPILFLAPKIDNITYLSAILTASSLYAYQKAMYPQNLAIAALFFSTMIMLTNLTISLTIDWVRTEFIPHETDAERKKTTEKESILKTLTTTLPALRLFTTLVALIFAIVIYHATSPQALTTRTPNLYFKYLTTIILFALPTIYLSITFYGAIMEKIKKEAWKQNRDHAELDEEQTTKQQIAPMTMDM